MNVLIVGGHEFIRNHVAQKFYNEGWNITVICKRDVPVGGKYIHYSYELDSLDKRCDTIFKGGNFDLVLYLETNENKEKKHYMDDFLHISSLCIKHQIKKFLFLSVVNLYEDKKDRNSVLFKFVGDYLKETMKNTTCKYIGFRVGEVYGPNSNIYDKTNWVNSFIREASLHNKVTIKKEKVHQLLYVEDLADAIYKGAQVDTEGIIDLTSDRTITEEEILSLLKDKGRFEHKSLKNENNLTNVTYLDNQMALKLLGWKPKYSVEQGISKTYQWYEENKSIREKIACIEERFPINVGVLPYIENLLCFLIIFAINYAVKDNLKWHNVFPLDLSIIYIFVMSIIYGMKQGVLSAILSSISYIYIYLSIDKELSVILYNQNHIIHIFLYFIIAIMTSYFMDNKKRENVHLKEDIKLSHNEIKFITNLYEDNVRISNKLQEQILSSEDSLGKIYDLTKDLNSLLVEDVFIGAVLVIEKLMKTTGVSLYKLSDKEDHLMLIIKSKNLKNGGMNLINIADKPYLNYLVSEKKIVINRRLEEDMPIMLAPITYNSKVIGAIFLEEMPFENLTLYYENFFKIAIGLIEAALKSALIYEEAISKEKYVLGTRVLKTSFLEIILKNKERIKELFGVNYTTLEVKGKYEQDDNKLLSIITKCIREIDYVGVDIYGRICIILSNMSYGDSEYIIQKLLNNGVQVALGDKV